MRVAFVGKGGAGKSAIAGTFARLLARQGEQVLVLDTDPMPGLAVSLGTERTDAGLPDDAVVEDEGGGPRYRLRDGLSPEEAVDRYALRCPDGVRLLQVGKLHGHARTLIRSQHAFREIVDRLTDERPAGERLTGERPAGDRWSLVGDLPGGTRQPFSGWGRFARTVLVVVEPTGKSRLAARRLRRLGEGEDVPRVLAVANKVREADDAARIADATGLEVVAEVPWDPAVEAAERLGRAPLDHAPDGAAVTAVGSLVERVRRQEVEG
jgi:CO dehydrogenase maturation factor